IDDLEYRQKSWNKAIREFAEFLGSGKQWVVCGWNVNFDLSFLHSAFCILPPHKRPRLAHRVVDLYSLCAWWGDQPAYTSESACRAFGIEVEPDAHRAINGVIWAAELLAKLNANKRRLMGLTAQLDQVAAKKRGGK
ncbi:hypothetical protein RZS08_08670, partial [Arthrospira platensis SPKY1]|nr:hypothetical protein [Arthrospira platensis SPKY1]